MPEKKRIPCKTAFCLIGASGSSGFSGCSSFLVRYARYHSVAYQPALGQKYLEELRYGKAILAFGRVIEIDPMNVDAYLGMAQAYLGKGETENVIAAVERGIEATDDIVHFHHLSTRYIAKLRLKKSIRPALS